MVKAFHFGDDRVERPQIEHLSNVDLEETGVDVSYTDLRQSEERYMQL